MLKRLHLKNFTVFADADFEFGPGLNVLVGTNGTGKSHVLKLGYAVLKEAATFSKGEINGFELTWNEHDFQNSLRETLNALFQPERKNLGKLINWQNLQGKTSVLAEFGNDTLSRVWFGILSAALPEYTMQLIELSEQPKVGVISEPVFIPAKEVLTLAWISRLSEVRKLPIDVTYPDVINFLRQIPLVQPELFVVEALSKLENLLGGVMEQQGDRFYLIPKEGAQVEMNLVAEGVRKFGMLFQLLSNGSITRNMTLYWDEPEANLNPLLLRKLAAILAELARQGFQIILATHSMSLLKEFHILSRQENIQPLPIRYFGLNAEPGQPITVVTRDDFKFLPDVVALEVELEQADDLEGIFAKEDQQFHADNH